MTIKFSNTPLLHEVKIPRKKRFCKFEIILNLFRCDGNLGAQYLIPIFVESNLGEAQSTAPPTVLD
jgi:hypothetical protein